MSKNIRDLKKHMMLIYIKELINNEFEEIRMLT